MLTRELFDCAGDLLPRPHGNCYWLIAGRLLAGEHPQGRLAALRDAGVSTTIDLTSTEDPVPSYEPLAAGVLAGQRLSHPITDFGVPGFDAMQRIECAVIDALAAGRGLYLHCRAGIGRTGTVAACLMVSAGYSADEALALLLRKWQAVDKRHLVPQTPETPAQREFVRRWASR